MEYSSLVEMLMIPYWLCQVLVAHVMIMHVFNERVRFSCCDVKLYIAWMWTVVGVCLLCHVLCYTISLFVHTVLWRSEGQTNVMKKKLCGRKGGWFFLNSFCHVLRCTIAFYLYMGEWRSCCHNVYGRDVKKGCTNFLAHAVTFCWSTHSLVYYKWWGNEGAYSSYSLYE